MTEAEFAAWRAHLVQWSAAQVAGSGTMLADETLAEQERQTRQALPEDRRHRAIAGRMFALVRLGQTPASVSLKGDPDLAVGLRGRSAAITPGHHLTKRRWNTVTLDGSVPGEKALELIGQSCDLVVARLTTAQRDRLITKPPSAAARTADMPMIGY